MVYTSGAVSIEHEGVARVFYSKTEATSVYHKPQATPWYNCLVQCNRAGPYLGTDCARGYQIAAWRYCTVLHKR